MIINNNSKMIINNNSSKSSSISIYRNWDELFFSVWRNIYLRNQIEIHRKRYREGEKVSIKSMSQFLNYPYRSYIKEINIYSNEELLPNGIIPYGTEILKFKESYNKTIRKDDIPVTVKELFFTRFYNQEIDLLVVPRDVQVLHIPMFDQKLEKDALPPLLCDLYLNLSNQELEIGVLPKSLTSLNLNGFNKSIKSGSLQCSLKSISFNKFNQELKINDLPDSCEKLELIQFEKPLLKGVLPSNLKSLHLNFYNYQFNDNILPTSITHLYLHNYCKSLSNVLPKLKSLKYLELFYFNDVLYRDTLPKSLETLKMFEFNRDLEPGVIPSSVRNLWLLAYNNHLKKDVLPNGLINLEMASYNRGLGINLLPNSIKTLSLGRYSKQFKANDLPSSITELKILSYKHGFERNISLPPNLLKLELGFGYNQLLKSNSIPDTCISISLDKNYKHKIPLDLSQRTNIIFKSY